MNKFILIKITTNILIVTVVIGLAITYISKLFVLIPDLSFLESVGIYCLWTPIHHLISSIFPYQKTNTD